MSLLQAAVAYGEGQQAPVGAGAVGTGTDVVAELERLRSNLVALAEIVERLRTAHNGHTHGGAVPAPPPAEQATTAFTLS